MPRSVTAFALIAVLLALAALHAYWGFGGVWPGTDQSSLVAMVVGRTRGGAMPGLLACLFVTAALLAVAALVAWRAGLAPGLGLPSWLLGPGYWGAALVFAARGAAGFVPAIFRYAEGTPFYDLNRTIYSPLCLAIALAMLAAGLIWAWPGSPSHPPG